MMRYLLPFLFVSALCNDNGKLFLQTPASVRLNPSVTSISSSDVTDAVRQMLGFTVQAGSSWHGIESISPFNVPKAAMIVEVRANADFDLQAPNQQTYNLNWNEGLRVIHKMLSCSYDSNFQSKAEDVALLDQDDVATFENDHPELTANIQSNKLHPVIEDAIYEAGVNLSSTGIPALLSELNYLLQLTDQVASKVRSHGLFVFRVNSFKDILHTDQMKPASIVLAKVLDKMRSNIMKTYGDNAVIITEVVDEEHVRRVRNILAAGTDAPSGESADANVWNLAKQYTSEYQNTFAAVLFLLLVLTLSILTVSLIMWNMDPGRDSIIYRMTSQRVKID